MFRLEYSLKHQGGWGVQDEVCRVGGLSKLLSPYGACKGLMSIVFLITGCTGSKQRLYQR